MSLRPTFYDFELNDGRIVQVTRNYAGLYMLKAYNQDLYEKSQTFNRKAKGYVADDLDNAEVLYASYVTATLMNNSIRKSRGEAEEEIISEVDFLTLMPTEAYMISNIFTKLFGDEKKKSGFQEAFRKATKRAVGTKIKIPNFPLEDIEDYYTYYVQIMKVPEDIFWNADIPFIDKIVENKTAYDEWLGSVMQKEREKALGKK